MTKLKNTKKGMAKKALSISLVAAMLATSNVPVWAAEDLFSDGSAAVEAPSAEVDTFSAAPVEEVNTDALVLNAGITSVGLNVPSESKKSDLNDVEVSVDSSVTDAFSTSTEWSDSAPGSDGEQKQCIKLHWLVDGNEIADTPIWQNSETTVPLPAAVINASNYETTITVKVEVLTQTYSAASGWVRNNPAVYLDDETKTLKVI